MTTRRQFVQSLPAFAAVGLFDEGQARADAPAPLKGHFHPKGKAHWTFTIHVLKKSKTPDNGETFLIELENATLTNIQGFLADKPDLTLTINRSDLEQTMKGGKSPEAQIKDGTAKAQGDVSVLKKLASTMVDFDPRFPIMPGTKARDSKVAHADPYEAVPRAPIAE